MKTILIVDGMLSGTGIRDKLNGGYVDPESLGVSNFLIEKLHLWHLRYEDQFYNGYRDEAVVEELDQLGIEISKEFQAELVGCKVSYFSDAKMSDCQ